MNIKTGVVKFGTLEQGIFGVPMFQSVPNMFQMDIYLIINNLNPIWNVGTLFCKIGI